MAPLSNTSQPAISSSSHRCIEIEAPRYTTGPTTQGAKGSAVRFFERVQVRKTIHVKNFTKDEIDACWYSDQDFDCMRDDVYIAGNLIDEGLLETDNEDCCRRGAEDHAPLQSRRRRKIKRAVREAVKEEQRLQWEENSSDPEFIAQISQIKSSPSLQLARERALNDERAATMQ